MHDQFFLHLFDENTIFVKYARLDWVKSGENKKIRGDGRARKMQSGIHFPGFLETRIYRLFPFKTSIKRLCRRLEINIFDKGA